MNCKRADVFGLPTCKHCGYTGYNHVCAQKEQHTTELQSSIARLNELEKKLARERELHLIQKITKEVLIELKNFIDERIKMLENKGENHTGS